LVGADGQEVDLVRLPVAGLDTRNVETRALEEEGPSWAAGRRANGADGHPPPPKATVWSGVQGGRALGGVHEDHLQLRLPQGPDGLRRGRGEGGLCVRRETSPPPPLSNPCLVGRKRAVCQGTRGGQPESNPKAPYIVVPKSAEQA